MVVHSQRVLEDPADLEARVTARLQKLVDYFDEREERRAAARAGRFTDQPPRCVTADVPPETWVHEHASGRHRDRVCGKCEQAVKLCDQCRYRAPCLELALTNHLPFGVWGGRRPSEIVELRKERRKRADDATGS